jgi:hypothetical protein
MRLRCLTWFVLLLCITSCKRTASSGVETIETLAVLPSSCVDPHQSGPEDLSPVRYVYSFIRRDDDRARVQYREFDANCRSVSTANGQWTIAQFEDAKRRFKEIGINNRELVAPGESSGNLLPVSFLKVRSSAYNIDLYTMYLRFRWAGTLTANDAMTAKALNVWRDLLAEATPPGQTKSGIEEVKRIADNCAKDWPASFNASVCRDAQQTVHAQ